VDSKYEDVLDGVKQQVASWSTAKRGGRPLALPCRITVGGEEFALREVDVVDGDECAHGITIIEDDRLEIQVAKDQPDSAKITILIHEVLHAVDEMIADNGITEGSVLDLVGHNWIAAASPLIAKALISTGIIGAVSLREFTAWEDSQLDP
jgi:hypothetical protein